MTNSSPLPPPPPRPPSFIQPALALVAGLGITVLVIVPGIFIAVSAAMMSGVDPRALQSSPVFLVVNLLLSALGAAAGGYVTARLSKGRSFYAVLLLAAIFLASGIAQIARAQRAASSQPRWYLMATTLIVPACVLAAGAWKRRRDSQPTP